MFEELRTALVSLLTGNIDAVVYDYVPENQSFPYVRVGQATHTAVDTDSSNGALVRVPLEIFSNYKGGKQAALIQGQIYDLLHHTDSLTLSTAAVVTVYVEESVLDPDIEGGELREGALTIAVLVDDITPGTA